MLSAHVGWVQAMPLVEVFPVALSDHGTRLFASLVACTCQALLPSLGPGCGLPVTVGTARRHGCMHVAACISMSGKVMLVHDACRQWGRDFPMPGMRWQAPCSDRWHAAICRTACRTQCSHISGRDTAHFNVNAILVSCQGNTETCKQTTPRPKASLGKL